MRPSPPSAAGSTPAPTALRGEDDPASLKEFGSSTTVPQNDICRLSYYLKCCILGCGFREASIALPVEVIMDYNNAHRLPSSLQRAIYHIVMSDFHPQTLMNRVFFVDDSSTLLEPDTMNAFFEWSTTISRALRMAEQGSGGMGIGVISDEQGQHAPSPNVLRKLMVCTSSWLNEYCILPLYRVSERLAMSALSFSSIAAAASGGGCGETSAAPNARDHSASLFLSDHQEGQYGGGSEQHPRAFSSRNAARFCCAATCTCRQNPRTSSASPPVDNEQYHAHEVVCGGRDCVAGGASTPIRGPRYRCKVCPNFDQCEICYNDLAGHDQTHAFEMIASRTCVRPRLLQARVQAVTECCSSTLYNNDRQEDVPVAFAVPVLPHQEIEKEDDGTDGLVVSVKKKHKRPRLS
jgi:hypothetical protein